MAGFTNKTTGCIFNSAKIYAPATIPDTIDTLVAGLTEADKFAITDGGVTISCVPEIVDIPYAGSFERRNVEDQMIIKWDVKVEGEVFIFNEKVLKPNLMSKDTTITSTKYDKFAPKTGAIAQADYVNLVIVGTIKGKTEPCIAIVRNCLNYEGLSIETKDKESGKSKMVFEGAYDSEKVPFELYFPKTV